MRMPPGWDGLETIEQLWRVDPNLQIALCTAYSDYSWEAMAERLEFGDQLLILKKPFDSLEIRQMANALTWKWQLAQDAALKMLSLERTIEARVHELLKVSHLLQYDSLTDLPNSTLLGDRLSQALAVSRRHDKQLVVMFLGLDRFKRINNALGHPAGDEMLKRVGQQLLPCVRESDSVFRYGSDEFVVILSDINHPQQTHAVAEKLLAAIRVPQTIAGHDVSVTASLGISVYPEDGLGRHRADQEGRDRDAQRQGNRPQRHRFLHRSHEPARAANSTASSRAFAGRCNSRNSSCTTSRKSTCAVPGWSGPRRWCAGRNQGMAGSIRQTSSRWPRTAD